MISLPTRTDGLCFTGLACRNGNVQSLIGNNISKESPRSLCSSVSFDSNVSVYEEDLFAARLQRGTVQHLVLLNTLTAIDRFPAEDIYFHHFPDKKRSITHVFSHI